MKLKESKRKATHVAADRVVCYLGVFEAAVNGTSTNVTKILEACSNHVNTTSLTIEYGSVPSSDVQCELLSRPCGANWTHSEYESQSWHQDAPTAACTPCRMTAVSTTSTTTTITSGLPLTRQAYDEGKLILNDYKGDPNPSVVTFSGQDSFTQTYYYLAWGFTAAAWAEAGLTDWNGNWTVQFNFMYTSQVRWHEGFYFNLDDGTNCGQDKSEMGAIFFVDGRGAQQRWAGYLSTTSSNDEVTTALKKTDTPMYWEVAHVAGGGVTFKLFKESSGELLLEAATTGKYEVFNFRDDSVVPISIYHKMFPVVFSGVKVKEAVSAA